MILLLRKTNPKLLQSQMSLYETLQIPDFRHTLEKLLLNLYKKGEREGGREAENLVTESTVGHVTLLDALAGVLPTSEQSAVPLLEELPRSCYLIRSPFWNTNDVSINKRIAVHVRTAIVLHFDVDTTVPILVEL